MIVNRTGLLRAAPIIDMCINKVQAEPTSYGLTECGYDIRLAEDVLFWPPLYHISGSLARPASYSMQGSPRSFGSFVLGSSVEEFNMPTNLMGRVLNKSTWARKGLDASMTTNIEPGWRGFLTIELTYHGQEQLHIPAGSGICQIIFERIEEPTIYVGKYQDQQAGPVPAKIKCPHNYQALPMGSAQARIYRCTICNDEYEKDVS